MSDHKTISIEEALIPINAKLFGDNFDPRFQTVHAFECGGGDICVSEELYQAMCNHFAATDGRLERERDEARAALRRYEDAVWWAMGLRGDFGLFDRPFGWRGELARRCGLSGDDVNREARKAAGLEDG